MGAPIYTWTPETESGFLNDELLALWAQINTNEADIGLLDGITEAEGDARYLKLDATNDPITEQLEIAHDTAATLRINDTGGEYYDLISAGDVLYFKEGGATIFRYKAEVLELPAHTTAPTGLGVSRAGVYQDETPNELWAAWREAGGTTHNAMLARAKGSVVNLSPGSAIGTSGLVTGIGGSWTDKAYISFPEAAGTESAAWSTPVPEDWKSLTSDIRFTIFWLNPDSRSGNHSFYHLLTCVDDADDLDTGTPPNIKHDTGEVFYGGVSNSWKVVKETYTKGSTTTFAHDLLTFRMQRRPANGGDTSGGNVYVLGVSIDLV